MRPLVVHEYLYSCFSRWPLDLFIWRLGSIEFFFLYLYSPLFLGLFNWLTVFMTYCFLFSLNSSWALNFVGNWTAKYKSISFFKVLDILFHKAFSAF